MTGADDTVLTGHSLSWRGARVGIVARTLIDGRTAMPLIFVDEIDKPQAVGHADLLDPLHALLEPENARQFVDSYLEVPIRADKVLWIATANEISHLKPSLIDRFLVLRIAPPSSEERRAIVRSLYDGIIASYAGAFDELAADAIDALADATPRRTKMIVELAIGFAMADRRRSLAVSDIHAAQQLADSSVGHRGIGFFAAGL